MADPFFYQTRLVLQFDGSDGAAISTAPFYSAPWWKSAALPGLTGGGTLSTAQKVSGASSAYFNNSSGRLLYEGSSASNIPLLTIGSDYTVEFWYRPDDTSPRHIMQAVAPGTGGTGSSFAIFSDSSQRIWLGASNTFPRISSAAGTVVANTWMHIAFTSQGGANFLFVNGILCGIETSAIWTTGYLSAGLTIGGRAASAASGVTLDAKGFFDDLRITAAAKYGANFTPSTSAFDTSTLPVPAGGAAIGQAVALRKLGAQNSNFKLVVAPPSIKDIYYGGIGKIEATVKQKASPTNLPIKRRVRLLRDRDGVCIRETWSDPITGNYKFENIDERERYSSVAYDHEHNYRAEIADNLTPTV